MTVKQLKHLLNCLPPDHDDLPVWLSGYDNTADWDGAVNVEIRKVDKSEVRNSPSPDGTTIFTHTSWDEDVKVVVLNQVE